mmetsp:Transcript_61741/g.130310  ORF Transcript_61741/g.130310 Transcript_61741/m.130310 type:complete len:352 (+) Transcript_61741:80-1135(+)|eukprot:CAMPEP_0206449816 /NCGR_PEP_ID=MMETSP0324_2-20121206/18334_1 /ASSEMBLY_ACC=CAM_ASM_000836 /TAXON_ID=2866 /ORGANISM="Crypthecodinium cohnii, Strain Seligo" /LENGTH=351 /DNA_ID=CAMNT_0053919305 /DNA_START=32 /DNA_END=1087 /DNA_ORIENTATION=+
MSSSAWRPVAASAALRRAAATAGWMEAAGRRRWCVGVASGNSTSSSSGMSRPIRWRPNATAFDPRTYTVPPHIQVPASIPRPSYADHPDGHPRPLSPDEYAQCKTPQQIEQMRSACSLAAEALQLACSLAVEGVTTDEVDRKVAEFVISRNAYPVGINYLGFPRGLCASVNEVALHGVPNTRPLSSGDIVNFDLTVYKDSAFGDCSAMVMVGDVDEDARDLVSATRECLYGAIDLVRPGIKLNSIGKFCQEFASSRGYGVVAEFCGHFIGSELHMKPNVLHVPNGNGLVLRPGMTFTIEPILVEGACGAIKGPLSDNWTIVSQNGGWSAQWEHTVLVTEDGVEILTKPPQA